LFQRDGTDQTKFYTFNHTDFNQYWLLNMSVICVRDFKKRREQSAQRIAEFIDRKASGVRNEGDKAKRMALFRNVANRKCIFNRVSSLYYWQDLIMEVVRRYYLVDGVNQAP
jgi:hypothetical protein